MLPSKKILFIIHGSIAAYKVCTVISKLVQNNFEVKVVASEAALKFLGKATLEGLSGNIVLSDLYHEGRMMDHIRLIRWADLIVSAPASANAINKMARGIGDDLASTLFLAHDFKKPWLIAPAMNTAMFEHPLTQQSLESLKKLGLQIVDSPAGALACGEVGRGRLIEPEALLQVIEAEHAKLNSKLQHEPALQEGPIKKTAEKKLRKLPRILITSGGTIEKIDDVRFIGNFSSGKTGVALAESLTALGFEVHILRSEQSQTSSLENQSTFSDFASLRKELKLRMKEERFDVIIHAAAVSDYSVSKIRHKGKKLKEARKISSDFKTLSLDLKRNPKIIDELPRYAKHPVSIIAFKLLSGADSKETANAVSKLFKNNHIKSVVSNDWQDYKNGQRIFSVWSREKQAARAESYDALTSLLIQEMGVF